MSTSFYYIIKNIILDNKLWRRGGRKLNRLAIETNKNINLIIKGSYMIDNYDPPFLIVEGSKEKEGVADSATIARCLNFSKKFKKYITHQYIIDLVDYFKITHTTFVISLPKENIILYMLKEKAYNHIKFLLSHECEPQSLYPTTETQNLFLPAYNTG